MKITREDYVQLKIRLDRLYEKSRDIKDRISSAKTDLEFVTAKKEQADVEKQIKELEGLLDDTQVVNPSESKGLDSIGLNSVVDVVDFDTGEKSRYTLTSLADSAVLVDRIPLDSPIGTALMGHIKGDIVDVPCPDGSYYTLEILDVSHVNEDNSNAWIDTMNSDKTTIKVAGTAATSENSQRIDRDEEIRLRAERELDEREASARAYARWREEEDKRVEDERQRKAEECKRRGQIEERRQHRFKVYTNVAFVVILISAILILVLGLATDNVVWPSILVAVEFFIGFLVPTLVLATDVQESVKPDKTTKSLCVAMIVIGIVSVVIFAIIFA